MNKLTDLLVRWLQQTVHESSMSTIFVDNMANILQQTLPHQISFHLILSEFTASRS